MTRYTAVVRVRKGTAIIHREAKTFAHLVAARSWARHREVALENPEELLRAQEKKSITADTYQLGKLIRWYIDRFETISDWKRSKQTHLEFLERHPIANRDTRTLTTGILIEHIQGPRADGAGPATVANDLTWIGVVLRAAKSVKGAGVRPEVVQEARNACRELRLIGKSKKRVRRPTRDELARLDAFFAARDRRSIIPMRDILQFAIQSARREAEICRLEWDDNDPSSRSGLVQDAKHPTEKEGHHGDLLHTGSLDDRAATTTYEPVHLPLRIQEHRRCLYHGMSRIGNCRPSISRHATRSHESPVRARLSDPRSRAIHAA